MKVLVIGGGGREHAVCLALSKSERVTELLCAPGNGGIARVARCIPEVKATDVEGIVRLSKEEHVDFVVVTPDDPLALGCVDRLEAEGIRAFGPTQAAARMESSKIFSKELMRKYHIPTAKCEVFTDCAQALSYLDTQEAPIVVKADGLALGKGVVVAQTIDEAKEAVRDMMQGHKFGESGARVLIEECMFGREVTVLCFCDGKTLRPMPASQDHKRAFDGDLGPNTGGMGAFAPSPLYTPAIAQRVEREILQPTLAAMNAEGFTFKGVLYVGLMMTPTGPRVVEYNARFGDPETQAILPLLDADLMAIFEAVEAGRLKDAEIRWKNESAACVVLASGGYPGAYASGLEITGIEDAAALGATVYHAGTRAQGGRVYTAGGRVLGVTATARTLREAVDRAYAAAGRIHFDGMHMRRDIGSRDA
ncbi:phosphoribosylamine--glycine ligase [Beduinella massiliensis]|uniref:phosphoribosylamine--glycine ligase n=1 Tax=Beduinella massiliensis TaxID=1852363 RepID=UPI000C84FE60